MDIFADAIGSVVSIGCSKTEKEEVEKLTSPQNNKSTIGFQHLWHWTEKAGKIYRSKMKHVEALDLHVPLLDIHPEGKLQREIKDIIDELDMMIHVIKKQKEVIKRFYKHVDHIFNPNGPRQTSFGHAAEQRRKSRQSWGSLDDSQERRRDSAFVSNENQTSDDELRKQQFDSFHVQAQELLEEVGDRMEELEDLKRNAESTAQGVSAEFDGLRLSTVLIADLKPT